MLSNSKGMSLIQVMIALGLMSVIGLGVAELMVTSAKISKRSDTKLSQLVLMNEMQSIISSPTTCSNMVTATTQTYDQSAAQGAGWDIEFQVSPTQTLKTGTKFNNDLRIKRLYLKEEGIDTSAPTQTTYQGRVFMEFDGNADSMIGGALREREVGFIYYTVNSSNELINCNRVVETTPSDICMQMGGTYDYSTESCAKFNYSGCTTPTTMYHGQSYTENYSSGGKNCFRTFTCIDGQRIKTTDFCETATVDVPPSGPSGDECVPPDTRIIAATCSPSYYTGGRQKQQCIDGYWVDSGGVYNCTFSCFIAETKIKMYNNEELPISQVQVGDYVLGEDGAINEVYDIEIVPLGGRPLFSFNDGPHFVTAEHPFKTTLGWKSFSPEATFYEHFFQVKEQPLEAGDLLYTYDDQFHTRANSEKLDNQNKSTEMLRKISTRHDRSNLMVYNLRLKAAPISPYSDSDDRSNTYFANGYLVHNK